MRLLALLRLEREFAVADAGAEPFGESGGRVLAIGGDEFGEGCEQAGLRQAVAVDAVELGFGPGFMQVAQSYALLLVVRYRLARVSGSPRCRHCHLCPLVSVEGHQSLVPIWTLARGANGPSPDLKERLITHGLISVSRGDFAGDLGAFIEISANHHIGGGRTGPISLLKPAVTTIEAGDDLAPPFAIGRLGVDQSLHLVAPFLAFIGAANPAQILQRAEDFSEPLQVLVERC